MSTVDDIDLSPPEPPFRARQLDQLIERWLENCHVRLDQRRDDGSLNTYTADIYANKIAYFRRWWSAFGPSVNWEMHKEDLIAFRSWLGDQISQYNRPLSYNTRKDVLRRLRQMFNWSKTSECIKRDIALWVPDVDGSAPLRSAVPITYLIRLKEACLQTQKPIQSLAILAILMDTGMRRAECAGLAIEDIRIDADGSGTIIIRNAKRVSGREVQGRTCVFSKHAGKYIVAHIDSRIAENQTRYIMGVAQKRTHTEPPPADYGPLFVGADDVSQVKPDTIYKTIKRLVELAGLKGKIQGPHDLRRRFITTFRQLRRGESHDHLLSKQTGQLNPKTVQQYDLQDVEDLREVFISPFILIESSENS